MFVCVCHALKGSDVEDAAARGVCCAGEFHSHFGTRPQCGRCLPTIRSMLLGRRVANEDRGGVANDPERARAEG